LRLHYNKFSRATRVRWLLEELGATYEINEVAFGPDGTRSMAHLEVHPLGKLPALTDDDGTHLFESSALVLHLADKYPGLAPAPGTSARGRYYQWVVYGVAELEAPVAEFFFATRVPEEQKDPARIAKAQADFDKVAAPVEAVLARHDWILGAEFSAADCVVGGVLTWADRMGMCEKFPAIHAYAGRCAARPAFKRGRQ